MAPGEGGPIYCLISTLSTKARSIAPVTLEVVRIITLLYLKMDRNHNILVVKKS